MTANGPATYRIPVTFTTNRQPTYDDVHPTMMIDNTIQMSLPHTLLEDDYVIFNIQGQGYLKTIIKIALFHNHNGANTNHIYTTLNVEKRNFYFIIYHTAQGIQYKSL